MRSAAPASSRSAVTPVSRAVREHARRLRIQLGVMADSLLQGDNPSSLPGAGVEVTGVRAYRAGDEVRGIDWRVTARRGRLHVREFAQERELPMLLVLDLSPSLVSGRGGVKALRALEVTALLAAVGLRGGDRVGLLVPDRTAQPSSRLSSRIVPPGNGRTQLDRIVGALLEAQAAGSDGGSRPRSDSSHPALAHALENAARTAAQRTRIFVIGDYRLPPAELSALPRALSLLRQRHHVIAVRVIDLREAMTPASGALYLRDPWSGKVCRHGGREARKHLAERLRRQDERTEAILRRLGIEAWNLDVGEPLVGSLRRHLYRRPGRPPREPRARSPSW